MLTIKLLMGDLAFVTYGYLVIVGIYTLCLFVYWAVKSNGVASAWYYYVMGLILSGVLSTAFAMTARYLYLTQHEYHGVLLNSFPWAARLWVGAGVMTAIAIHATRKLYKSKG